MSKRYEVYYRLNGSFKKNIILTTDNLDEAVECYANFIYDNYFSDKIDFCSLVDNNYTKRLMYTDFIL